MKGIRASISIKNQRIVKKVLWNMVIESKDMNLRFIIIVFVVDDDDKGYLIHGEL